MPTAQPSPNVKHRATSITNVNVNARRLHAESFRAKVELPSRNAIGTEGNTAFRVEVEAKLAVAVEVVELEAVMEAQQDPIVKTKMIPALLGLPEENATTAADT